MPCSEVVLKDSGTDMLHGEATEKGYSTEMVGRKEKRASREVTIPLRVSFDHTPDRVSLNIYIYYDNYHFRLKHARFLL